MSPLEFRFEVKFYREEDGTEPVVEFVQDVARSNRELAARMRAGLGKLEDSRYHRPPTVTDLGEGLYELRILGNNSARVLFFHGRPRRLVLVHAFLKKSQKTPKGDFAIARERKRRHEERATEDEDE